MFSNYKNWLIFRPFKDFYYSLFNGNGGFSYRKIASVFALYAAYQLQLSITNDNVKQAVIASWQIFAAVCIGLITIPQLISFLSSKKPKENEQA